MVLVNGETTGAAEALAAALREADAGLIIGNPTAGLAMTTMDFPLEKRRTPAHRDQPGQTGQWRGDFTRVAGHCGDGESGRRTRVFEKSLCDAGAERHSATVATNDFLPFVDHTSEADLVREKLKDGDDDGAAAAGAGQSGAKTGADDSRPGAGARGGFDQGTGHRA